MSGKTRFRCPKCGGNQFYFGIKQVSHGVGGFWSNQPTEEQRPFCKTCDIEGSFYGPAVERAKKRDSRKEAASVLIYLGFIAVGIFGFVVLSGNL